MLEESASRRKQMDDDKKRRLADQGRGLENEGDEDDVLGNGFEQEALSILIWMRRSP